MVSVQVSIKFRTLQLTTRADVPADLTNRLVVTYEPEHGTQMTPLSIQLEKIDANNHFPHQFRNAKRVLKALGSSASDLFWRHWMESEGGDLYTHTKIAMHKLIESWSFDMPNLSSSYSSSNVSSQFLKLAKILHSFEPHGTDFRGIVVGMLIVKLSTEHTETSC